MNFNKLFFYRNSSRYSKFGTLFQYILSIKHKTHNTMEKVTFTLVFILWATLGLLAQRGGGHYDHSNNNNNNNGYHNQNTGGQAQYGSMMTLNRGNNPGGLRPNGNVGNPPTHNGTHHGHNHNTGHNHNHNQGHNHNHHACSHGNTCTFGCTSNHYVHAPVHITAFSGWLHSLKHQCNSAVRMSMALDYVEHNWLTTHQIYDVLGAFSNQSSMLMIAESAYPNTCDPQNYHYLYNCFSNNACIMNLQSFIRNY